MSKQTTDTEATRKYISVNVRVSPAEFDALNLIKRKTGGSSRGVIVRKALCDAHPEFREASVKG